jgi:hypothetical protein
MTPLPERPIIERKDREMGERAVYFNEEFVPESRAKTSAFDRGFQGGDAVYDMEQSSGGASHQALAPRRGEALGACERLGMFVGALDHMPPVT